VQAEVLRLNFACGGSRWDGFENSDTNREPGTVYVDLASPPYPYPDGSASLILLSHALFMAPGGEPLHPDLSPIMREFHRILEPGGWLRVDDNPLRCYDDAETVDPGEVAGESQRGYPDHLRITRAHLRAVLADAGFSEIHEVATGDTMIPGLDAAEAEAVLGNHMGHISFTVEACK